MDALRRYASSLAVILIVCASLAYGYSLDRYPSPYGDDAYFAFPAASALQGGPFAYPGGGADVPYGNEIWAHHGPVEPNINLVLFKLFGYHFALSRLTDFLPAWIAALLVVQFLNRQLYQFAGLIFAVLWCGDRATQEVMYARMEGIGLLCLVCLLLALHRLWNAFSPATSIVCGFLAGLCILIHPLCAPFAVISLAVIAIRHGTGALGYALLGSSFDVPVLVLLWHGHPLKAIQQFLYVAQAQEETAVAGGHLLRTLAVLRWGGPWAVLLLLFALACSTCGIYRVVGRVLQKRPASALTGWRGDTLLLSLFCGGAMILLLNSSKFPYYLVYVTVWPMTILAILSEREWPRIRLAAIPLALCWCGSAAWNLHQLSHRFLSDELRTTVPKDAVIFTSSALYYAPIEAGFRRRNLVDFKPHQQDICPTCYLLLDAHIVAGDQFIQRTNLHLRRVLYSGPAFPGAGALAMPVVLLSPEHPR
jgi:hypothetical protein